MSLGNIKVVVNFNRGEAVAGDGLKEFMDEAVWPSVKEGISRGSIECGPSAALTNISARFAHEMFNLGSARDSIFPVIDEILTDCDDAADTGIGSDWDSVWDNIADDGYASRNRLNDSGKFMTFDSGFWGGRKTEEEYRECEQEAQISIAGPGSIINMCADGDIPIGELVSLDSAGKVRIALEGEHYYGQAEGDIDAGGKVPITINPYAEIRFDPFADMDRSGELDIQYGPYIDSVEIIETTGIDSVY